MDISRYAGRGGKNSVRNSYAVLAFVVAFVVVEVCSSEMEAKLAWLELLFMYRQVSHIFPGSSKNSSLCFLFYLRRAE